MEKIFDPNILDIDIFDKQNNTISSFRITRLEPPPIREPITPKSGSMVQDNPRLARWLELLTAKVNGQYAIASIANAPSFIGQTAVVSGVGYLATGTSSAADWKQITG